MSNRSYSYFENMQKTTILVLLAMAALATAAKPKGPKSAANDPVLKKFVKETNTHLAILADEVDQINQLDWKTIDTLIDNKVTILADKKVIVDGNEVNKDFVFKLIGSLSRINWEHLHQLLNDHKSLVENEVSKQGNNPVAIADVLKRTERMKGVDWKNYFKSFGKACMSSAAKASSAKGGKLSEKEETMLKIAQKMDGVNKINWAEYNPKSKK